MRKRQVQGFIDSSTVKKSSPERLLEEEKRQKSNPKQRAPGGNEDISGQDAVKLLSFAKNHSRKKVDPSNLPAFQQPEAGNAPKTVEGPPEIYLHRNAQGGIYVHEKDIETLFNFIDSKNYGRITQSDLKKKISLFAKEMTNKDYKFLMAGKNEITIRELYDILKYNELEDFDPIAEAFSFFDPNGTGFVDLERLKEIFSLLGYEELSYGDLQILVECADADVDGKISLEDFRRLIPIHQPAENEQHHTKNINIVSDPELHKQFVANLKEYGDTRK